jgi:hypothetical protein
MISNDLAQLQPIHPWHIDVQQNEIWLCSQLRQGFIAAVGYGNRIAVIPQMGGKQFGQDWFIIHDQNSVCHGNTSNLFHRMGKKSKFGQEKAQWHISIIYCGASSINRAKGSRLNYIPAPEIAAGFAHPITPSLPVLKISSRFVESREKFAE